MYRWLLRRDLWIIILIGLFFAFYASTSDAKVHEYFKIYDDIYIELKVCGKTKYIFSSDARTIWWNKSENWKPGEIDAAKFGSMVFVIDDDEDCIDAEQKRSANRPD